MTASDHAPGNILAAQVAHWAATRPDGPAYTELRFRMQERVPVTLTYAGLHAAVGALAAQLRRESAPGDRVAILCAHGIDYAVAFLACLYSNRIAVPLFPAVGARNRDRLHAVLADARPTLTLLSAHDDTTAATLGPALGRVLAVALDPSTPSADPEATVGNSVTSTACPVFPAAQTASVLPDPTAEQARSPKMRSIVPGAESTTAATAPADSTLPTGQAAPVAQAALPSPHSAAPATCSAGQATTSVTEQTALGRHAAAHGVHPTTAAADPPALRPPSTAQPARITTPGADRASTHKDTSSTHPAASRTQPTALGAAGPYSPAAGPQAAGSVTHPAAAQVDSPVVDPMRGELAYLQYTSGSTKSPAGVRVTHENLAAALTQLRDALSAATDRPIVTWLPLFHDMGLILGLALPLSLGVHGVTLAPAEFVKRPIRWLRAIADYRAGITGCPNFALTLAVSGTTPQERTGLDLSGLDILLNGSEPVRADALDDFTSTFAPYGFRHHAHTPGFGLAEATLTVTVCDQRREPVWHRFERAALAEGRAVALPDDAPESQDGVPLVGCGAPAGQAVRVVDPATGTVLPAGRVGEIWVAGNNVCDGYFGRPDATEETFGATLARGDIRWLRTGDLGFRYEGQLYIAGRCKDVIVIDGRNHYPTDIETTVEACSPDIRPGHVTAFGHDDGRREDLVVVAELVTIATAEPAELSALARRIRTAVASTHEVTPGAVMLVEPGRIPKTSSGKLRRGECRARYLAGQLRPVAMI
ncbi:AMP-binding protein [Nocardia sp. NBC_00508]|uniref:fatty acyl-AMP ligase n=1 Tax=Nocardia sp. NBC_00508 TaxID=2975992 RepID=UPI002E7FDAB1|nr:AMP-binding protein [Nocardia sp. NBC_00508]WUD69357.1 AMP-binding protein [Nocardia sp. NBC_00508]